MGPKEPLRDRKRASTRRAIMLAAYRLFEERGYEDTSVSAIADEAEVGRRTFFRYFPGKVDVLFADHEELVALLERTLAERDAGESVLTAVRRATLTGVGQVVADPAAFLTRSRLVASIPEARARSRFLDGDYEEVIAIAAAAARGVDPASDLPSRLLARAAWAASRAAREVWVESAARSDPRQLVNEAFDHLEAGLGD